MQYNGDKTGGERVEQGLPATNRYGVVSPLCAHFFVADEEFIAHFAFFLSYKRRMPQNRNWRDNFVFVLTTVYPY